MTEHDRGGVVGRRAFRVLTPAEVNDTDAVGVVVLPSLRNRVSFNMRRFNPGRRP